MSSVVIPDGSNPTEFEHELMVSVDTTPYM